MHPISKTSATCITWQGTPAVLLGVLTYFLLPNRPESTTFFNEHEREIALERMNRSTSGDIGAVINKGTVIHSHGHLVRY